MDRLTEFINQTWFRTDGKKKLSDPEAEKQREELVKAQEKAVSNLWDLPFSFNIALEEKISSARASTHRIFLTFTRRRSHRRCQNLTAA